MTIFILGVFILTVIQFFGCRIYLSVSKKIKEPVDYKGQILIGVAWIVFGVFILVIGLAGMKLVDFSEVVLNRASGVIPVVIGSLFSIFKYKEEWKAFHSKYQKK